MRILSGKRRHIFLSGDSGAGKTTIVKDVLKLMNLTPGGFFTEFEGSCTGDERRLLLLDAANLSDRTPERMVALMSKDRPCTVFPKAFDRWGCAALENKDRTLLVMDECGRLELGALAFQRKVWKTLDGEIPVLGVLHYKRAPLPDAIRERGDVAVITVTADNRNLLATLIAQSFKARKLSI